MLELKVGAILVADAHYASYRPLFSSLIAKLLSKELQTTQLILMGDIFDLLMGPIDAFKEESAEIIKDLNLLSQRIEVVYLEGNHDFLLCDIFPNMKIFSLKQQPVDVMFEGKLGYLAHGDWGGDIFYRFFTFLIRSRALLAGLNFLDNLLKRKISKQLSKQMSKKNICSKFETFQEHINEKFIGYKSAGTWFIEGHYHQGRSFLVDEMVYYNLQAMACNKSCFVVQSNKNEVSLTAFTL